MSDYQPHPLVVAVADGIVNGDERGDQELFQAGWRPIGWTSSETALQANAQVEERAKTVAKDFAKNADASQVLALAGYLGAVPSVDDGKWQFLYLDRTLQSWLLVQRADIVSLARVPDEKEPFGCKPDIIWLRSYSSVIQGNARLTEDAIAAQISRGDFTTAAVAIGVLTRDANASPGGTFGEELLGQGFSVFYPCSKGTPPKR
jgi:hypothetical protein